MGLVVACGTLAAQRLALVLQCWVAHPDRDVESARAFIGFMVGVVPHLPLAVGMVLLGVTAHRRYLLARVARRALLVGMLVLPSLVLAAYLQDVVSTGGWRWDLALTATQVLLALAWAPLGWAVWSQPRT